eukprot:333379-Pleurochrysis_carterae.AAC.1
MPAALLRLDRQVHDMAADMLLVALDPLCVWTALKRCWSDSTGPPRDIAHSAGEHRGAQAAALPTARAPALA